MASKKKKLPTYELKINPNNGAFVDAIALVDDPAISSDFFAFRNSQTEELFAKDDEKREIIGAAMIPNLEMFRSPNPENPEGYYVTFSADTIREIAQTFFKKGLVKNLNLMHNDNENADSFVFQSFIVDSKKGINSPKKLNLPDGSWVIGIKVLSDDVWNKVKSGEYKGFSVQGIFEQIESKFKSNNNYKNDLEEIDLLTKQIESLSLLLNRK